MTDEEVNKRPMTALKYCADKLTPEQFDYCVHREPWAALEFCAARLTDEQIKYCEENTR